MSASSPACFNTINLDALHFTADELRSLNELVVTAVLESPSLSLFHTLETGIKNDKRIGIIPGTFGLIGKAAQACNPEAQCYENTAIEKTWEPKYVEIIIDMCIDELQDTLMKLALNCGIEIYDLTNTEVFAFILDILSKDIPKMLLRKVWFDDQAAANISAGGIITNGFDVNFFNVLNGFWQQLAVIYAADATRRTPMPGNAQLTYALQGTVATPLATFTAVNLMIDSAHPVLKGQPDRIILCTESINTRLMRHLQALGIVYDITYATDGLMITKWDGITMYTIPLWDQWIRAYEDSGVRWNNPHRAVYTTKSQLKIGMSCNGLFDNINSFYDQRSRINRIEAVDAFDAKIIDDRLVQVLI
jgi:hypothetical protein